jgi:tetratricopeptide (TPR) repeat protein
MSTGGELGQETLTDALTLHLLGICHAHEGRYEEAAGAFLRAIEAEPQMAGSYVELGLVYACWGDYVRMVQALGRAGDIGSGAVRAYLGERPLGDISTGPSPGMPGHGSHPARAGLEDGPPVVAAAISHLAAGRDEEAARELERESVRESGSAPATALLALSYLLRGESVEADSHGVRLVPAPPTTGE